MSVVGKIVEAIESTEPGGTFSLATEVPDEPADGYFVGGQDLTSLVFRRKDARKAQVVRQINDFVSRLNTSFVGWWTDPETGKVWLDGVEWYLSHDVAASVARRHGELAFWDIARQRELRLAYYVDGEAQV